MRELRKRMRSKLYVRIRSEESYERSAATPVRVDIDSWPGGRLASCHSESEEEAKTK